MLKIFFLLLGLTLSSNSFSDDSQHLDDSQELIDRTEEIYESINVDEDSSDDLANKVNELQEKYLGSGTNTQVINQKVNVEDAIKQINERYKTMPLELVRKEIFDNAETDIIKKAYKKYPNILSFVARMLKTEGALLDAFKVLRNQDVMKKFGLYMLGTLALSILISKLLIKVGQSFFTRFKMILLKSLIVWTARISIIVHFLGPGLSKMWHIFLTTFIS